MRISDWSSDVCSSDLPGPEFQPGAYLQVHVPDYTLQRHDIDHPEHHRNDWAALDLPATLANKEPVRRSYTLALPVEKAGGHLTLLARFSPGGQGKKRHPTGKDRKSVGKGKRVSVSVNLGGGRIIKKTKKK